MQPLQSLLVLRKRVGTIDWLWFFAPSERGEGEWGLWREVEVYSCRRTLSAVFFALFLGLPPLGESCTVHRTLPQFERLLRCPRAARAHSVLHTCDSLAWCTSMLGPPTGSPNSGRFAGLVGQRPSQARLVQVKWAKNALVRTKAMV